MSKEIVVAHQLTKRYPGGVLALDRVCLEVYQGEWIALTGPSGSGKTTLLNLIGGLDTPTSGEILVCNVPINRLNERERARFRRERIGFIFQQFHLVPYLSAVENVMLAQYLHSLPDEKEAIDALEQVGLADRLHHLPSELSGGEQQRVCIARALINEPDILLADEPTGNLDEASEEVVLDLLSEIHRDGRTIILVTHDPKVASRADRILKLEHGKLVVNEEVRRF